MKKSHLIFLAGASLLFSFLFGIYVAENRGIPFIKARQSYWSIGIYTAKSPIDIFLPANGIKNPVLTSKDITDVEAEFVADPFMIKKDNRWYMFFEVMNKKNWHGDIGLASSHDGKKWQYEKIVLDEPFHLAYPFVFQHDSKYYMIPDASNSKSIRLYEAENFPTKWKFVKTLSEGTAYVDSTLIFHEEKWWLFTTPQHSNDTLEIFYADDLLGSWKSHAKNPVIIRDANRARSGGRIVRLDNKLIRFAQDDEPTYGNKLRAFEIIELSIDRYKQRELPNSPVLNKGKKFLWNGQGMHHMDPHEVSEGFWLACTDGLGFQREIHWKN